MRGKSLLISAGVAVALAVLATGAAISEQDKNTVKVPGGLGFAEFKGYESWETISVSHSATLIAVIVGNPAMINAYKAGIPGNGKPFPDGAKMAKVHWTPGPSTTFPAASVPRSQHDVDFMVKDGKRFADSGGWGYAAFEHDAASNTFSPATKDASPPQGNDAKCGFACHTLVKNRDYVFTEYAAR